MVVEQVVQGKLRKNPDDLSELYINLVNDLSFAQTYYPKSKTTVYLNHLAGQVFQRIYKTRRIEKNRFLHFFMEEVPLLVYHYRRFVLFAFLFFFIFVFIGVISAVYDPNFTKSILGEDYVNTTIENIKKGNPVDIYKSGSNWGSTVGITFNNIMVGAKMYITGIFGGLGSLHALLLNSVMLGSFQYFFHQHGELTASMRGIWLHGTFEIFSMVMEASAGLMLGASVLFPGTFSRFESFKRGFRDSFKIFLSTLPFTIVAGIIEGYVTRFSKEMPLVLNLTIIFGCFLVISYYYLIYPFIVSKKQLHTKANNRTYDRNAVL